ncbi:class I SAM-dependent methyltransferase [Tateyamaria sp.]|uniref:class I SAM-dependent methyltransferase n=1 Tax=Tateyamaria sp. TaxID=1929288 RepID=UPI003B2175F5
MPAEPLGIRWAAIDPARIWSGVTHWFPPPPARVLDVGAGTGRDAAWFASLGYDVDCVEPDRSLWPDGAAWGQDALPDLEGVTGPYDLITICAVWHLVPEPAWRAAFARLGDLASSEGRLILSLRCPPIRDAGQVIATAAAAGWHPAHHQRRASVQPGNRDAGVMWDWCVFSRVAQGHGPRKLAVT